MHSSLTRLQNVFGFFTSVAFAVAAAIALSSLLYPQTPQADLEMRDVSIVLGRPHYYSTKKEEYAHIKFDLDADLSSLFSWNTKQLFVYIVAVFPSHLKPRQPLTQGAAPYSEAIIWDAIIPARNAPWHPNTYIHPGTSTSPKLTRDRQRQRISIPASKQSKNLRRHDPETDEATPYPSNTTEGILKLQRQRPKYQVTTPIGKISNLQNCTLYLRYNIQPWVGALVWNAWPPRNDGQKKAWYAPNWKELLGGKSMAFEFGETKRANTGVPTKAKKGGDEESLGTEVGGEANRGSPA